MASGDIVSGILATSGIHTFQPAVGVSVVLTWVGTSNASFIGLSDGVNIAQARGEYNNAFAANSGLKIFINNTNYFYSDTNSSNAGWSGIQL